MMRDLRLFTRSWLFYILLCQIVGVTISIVVASTKGGVDLHAFIYYLMFYLCFTNAIAVIASALFILFEKRLKSRLKSPILITLVV